MKTRWNKAKCLDFLRSFNAFEHKYLFRNDDKAFVDKCEITDKWSSVQWTLWDEIIGSQSHGISGHNLSCNEEAEAAMGIKQVYMDESHYTNEYLEMLNLVRDKFIYDYTGIKGICDFFAPAYFEYEWGMHLEINYDKHESKFYRDHYVHQIRNLFEMFSLLDNFGYYEKCRKSYEDPDNRIGTYVIETIEQEILSLNGIDLELYRKILKLNDPSFTENTDKGSSITAKYHRQLKELMLRHIIYSATVIASLTHDIGYPLSYIRRISGRLGKYLPISQLLATVNRDYSSIEQALQGSLLFSVVPSERIKIRLDSTEEHGAQSAIVLLMYFCQHGRSLSRLQRCAVELAALVVYNHTNKYNVINEADMGDLASIPDLIRSDIHKAPLSHIFRLCDDLQEWDRVYFEITEKSNVLICPHCMTPVIRQYNTDIKKPYEKRYNCCCTKSDNGLYDTNPFVTRRILNVIACDDVQVDTIIPNEDKKAGVLNVEQNQGNKPTFQRRFEEEVATTKFELNFDCGALLNIMTFSKTYSKVRANGIRSIKKLHSYQGKDDSILLDSFVCGNPFVVKTRILEQYVKSKMPYSNWTDLICDDESIRDNAIEEIIRSLDDVQVGQYSKLVIHKAWKNNLVFYCWLIRVGSQVKDISKYIIEKDTRIYLFGFNTTNHGVLKDYFEEYKKLLSNKELQDWVNKALIDAKSVYPVLGDDAVSTLTRDYFIQQVHLLGYEMVRRSLEKNSTDRLKLNGNDVRLQNLYRQFYENLYCASSDICNQVDKYISRDAYDDVKKKCNTCIEQVEKANGESEIHVEIEKFANDYKTVDFYVDYALFIKMWDKVKKTRSYYFTDKPLYLGDGSTRLQCITQECEFDGAYVFRVCNPPHQGEYDYIKVNINWENRKATLIILGKETELSTDDYEKYKTMLDELLKHHNVDLKYNSM